ncbi:MAG: hypothetical protein ACP5O3_03685 [Candidatus Micrarchaeia archaeon]
MDFKNLAKIVSEIPEIKKAIQSKPAKKRFPKILEEAVFWHQVKSPFYWAKSTTTDLHYHNLIASAAEGIPIEMNRFNARRGAEIAIKKLKENPQAFTIMDVGVGQGNTTRFLLEEIRKRDPQALQKIRLVLNDVEPSVETVAKKLSEEFGIKPDNIVVLPTTFYAASHAFGLIPKPPWKTSTTYKKSIEQLSKLRGKVDLLVSGASFNNFRARNSRSRQLQSCSQKMGLRSYGTGAATTSHKKSSRRTSSSA